MQDLPGNIHEERSQYKRLSIDSSLQSQEEDQYVYWLSLSGEQRVALATKLISAVYGRLAPDNTEKRIYFDIE